jgi:hypothetical protein
MNKEVNMKIAICGSGEIFDKEIARKASEIGKEIALSGNILLTGACHGYPNEAAKAAFSNGEVIGYSPASDEEEHVSKYSFPVDNFSSIVYTGRGIPDRNFDLIKNADAIILIDGKIGTLNEFTIAMHFRKKIGVLLGSGGISDMIKDIAEKIDKNGEKENIAYEKDVKKLIKGITL